MVLNARIDELQALNFILAQAGEIPVNALTNIPRNASRALETLREVTLLAQADAEFWRVNTRKEIKLQPDAITGKIIVAPDVVSVSAFYSSDNVTLRGDDLYDQNADSFIFAGPVTVNLRVALEWDDLPVQLRWYFQRVAAREYQQRWIANDKAHNYNVEEEARARSLAIASDSHEKRRSMLDNPVMSYYNNRYTGGGTII